MSTDYYQYKSDCEKTWLEAQRIIDHAENLYERGQINLVEFEALLAQAEGVQLIAKEMEKIAASEQVKYWREKYLEDYHREKDHQLEMVAQAELRAG